jgi:integrase
MRTLSKYAHGETLLSKAFPLVSGEQRTEWLIMKTKHAQNKRKLRGQMKPLTPAQVAAIEALLAQHDEWRALAMFRTAIDTMFRASDLVALTVDEVTGSNGEVLEEIAIRQKKTSQPVRAALSKETREALARWIAIRPAFWGDWLFTGRECGEHLSESQYRREAKRWFTMARLDTRFYSTHSLRRTKAALIYGKTGNVEIVRQLLGHGSTQATSRYLGIEVADALRVAREIKV